MLETIFLVHLLPKSVCLFSFFRINDKVDLVNLDLIRITIITRLLSKVQDKEYKMSGMPGSTPSPMQVSAPTPPPIIMNNGPVTSMAMNSPMMAAKRPVLESNEVLDKKRLQELVKEVDPNEQLDEEVESMLLQICDDFIEQVDNF